MVYGWSECLLRTEIEDFTYLRSLTKIAYQLDEQNSVERKKIKDATKKNARKNLQNALLQ